MILTVEPQSNKVVFTGKTRTIKVAPIATTFVVTDGDPRPKETNTLTVTESTNDVGFTPFGVTVV